MTVQQPQTGFEGSYLGATAKISGRAIMECKICWTPYDPEIGDEYRQILPGTPFLALPEDWKCPNCDAPKEQFMVLEDPGGEDKLIDRLVEERTAALVEDFKDVYATSMRGMPIINAALHIQAVGFKPIGESLLGVLITPWFMNLILLPKDKDEWRDLKPGTREVIEFDSGEYEFLHAVRGKTGGYKACSLFSPMEEFPSQMQAVEVARAVMVAIFDKQNREETDRSADIRKQREAELAVLETNGEAAESEKKKGSSKPEVSRRELMGLTGTQTSETG